MAKNWLKFYSILRQAGKMNGIKRKFQARRARHEMMKEIDEYRLAFWRAFDVFLSE